jgi:hypothetical protein
MCNPELSKLVLGDSFIVTGFALSPVCQPDPVPGELVIHH